MEYQQQVMAASVEVTLEQAQAVLSKGLDGTLKALELRARMPAGEA